jgi:DNA-binding transcriptional LysR family regulator
MNEFTLHDLQCFDAVVRAGGFQAAAAILHRTHPAVFAAVGKLERQLGLTLLDRSGYRVRPTEVGLSFQRRAQALLHALAELQQHTEQLTLGEEMHLRVVIGDLCPLPRALTLLGSFFARCPGTRLDLHFEAVTGPWERLFDGEADLLLHRIDKSDRRLEWIELGTVSLLPVAAPGFLPFPVTRAITPEQLGGLTQCIIRDSARHSPAQSHFVVEGAPQCTVADHEMKKQVILHGMAWGHLPRFLIEKELRKGQLVSLAGRHFPGVREELVAARRRDRAHGPVAQRLWQQIGARAREFRVAVGAAASAKRRPRHGPSGSG